MQMEKRDGKSMKCIVLVVLPGKYYLMYYLVT